MMRKVVVDGSNTSGFQRTALIATDGKLETSKGIVNISAIYLEEDAARKVDGDSSSITYNLDRLGIPLVEITTAADIKDAEHAKETAGLLGMILRSTGKVKRGLGTIRQDINLSIRNQPKIEIKGFQDLRSMQEIIEKEADRLSKLSKITSEVRKANEDLSTSFLRPMPGAARMYPETDIPIISISKELLARIKLPELLSAKSIRLEKEYNLSPELAKEVIEYGIDLDYYLNEYPNLEAKLIARTLIEIPKEIKARFNLDISKLKEENFKFVLSNLNSNNINKEAILDILTTIARGHKPNLDSYKQVSIEKVEEDIKNIISKNESASFNAIMGIAMQRYKGKMDAKLIANIINKHLNR